MAKISLTLENVESLNRAFSFYFEDGTTRDAEFSAGNLKWPDLESFLNDLSETGGLDTEANYKSAKAAIDKINIDFSEGAKKTEEDQNKANALTKVEREENERIRLENEAAHKKTIDDAKQFIDDRIKKQQELHDKLAAEQKKIYVKVEQPKPPRIDPEKQKYIDELKEQAKIGPQQLTQALTEQVNIQISANKGNLSDDEVDFFAKKAAMDTVNGLAHPEEQDATNVQIAILNKLAAEGRVIPKIIGSESIGSFREATDELSFFINGGGLSRGIIGKIDQDLAWAAFGDPGRANVSFYDHSVNGVTNVVSPDQLSSGYLDLLGSRSSSLGNYAGGEIKNFLLQQARGWLDNQVATMSPVIQATYNKAFVQGFFDAVGFGKSVPFGGTGLGGLVMKIPGASSFFEGLGNKLGIDFIGGAGKATANLATKALTTVGTQTVKTGIEVAAEVGAGAATGAATGAGTGAAAGAAAGAAGGPLAIITAVVGAVIGFVASAIPWEKLKKDGQEALAGAFSAAALGIGSIGTSLAGFASGVAGFFGALGSAFLGAVAMPILVTLLVFPVVVALILFIINSGAYIVPSGFSTNINITCNATQNGSQTSQTTSENPTASAAVCIVSYLNQFHLNPLLVALLNSPSWKSLAGVLSAPALDALAASAPVGGHLQCVGFVAATAGLAYGQAFTQIDACSYIGNPPSGYTYVSGTTGIRPGDFFLIKGSGTCGATSSGHIGVVISVDGALLSCADANNVGPGEAQVAHGCFALSQITGYLRK
jgi:hypothetical protein